MTTTYHTAIATGAAANAATFNPPLATLDAQLVADTAKIGTAASASGTLGTSIDTDGTLKAGSVDGSGVLANDVVTNDKLYNMTRGTVKVGGVADAPSDLDAKTSGQILVGDGTDVKSVPVSGDATLAATGALTITGIAGSAFTQPNLMWDPYFRHVPAGDEFDSRTRWAYASNLTIVDPDADNPFGDGQGATLRIGTALTTGGRYVWLDEMGLRTNDTLVVWALLFAASSTPCKLYCQFQTAASVDVGLSSNSGTVTPNNSTVTATVSLTVPATAAKIAIWVARTSGVAIDCYAMGITSGTKTSTVASPAISAEPWLGAMYNSTPQNLMWDPFNRKVPLTDNWGGRARWYIPASLTIVDPDTNNPYGSPTLRVPGTLTTGGKIIWMDEVGLKVGDTAVVRVQFQQTDGTATLYAKWRDAAGTIIGTQQSSGSIPMDGIIKTITIFMAAAGSGAKQLLVYIYHTPTTTDLDCYALWVCRGDYMPIYPTNTTGPDSWLTQLYAAQHDNLMWDPFNQTVHFPDIWGSRWRWYYPSALGMVDPDVNNPYGCPTLSLISAGTTGGKFVWLDEVGLKVGDTISAAIQIAGANGVAKLALRFTDADMVDVVSFISGNLVTLGVSTQTSFVLNQTIPAGTRMIAIAPARTTATGAISCYAMWLTKGAFIQQTPPPANTDTHLVSFDELPETFGTYNLRSFTGQIAKVQLAVAEEQCKIAFFGDSWINSVVIYTPVRDWLQTEYGNAGYGWVSASLAQDVTTGMTHAQAGTWVDSDFDTNPTYSIGPDGAGSVSSDIATPGKLTFVGSAHAIVMHYLKQAGGGSFRYRIDTGDWATIDTSNATSVYTTTTISGLDGNSHTLTIEVTVAGAAGVAIAGADFRKTGNGVRVHKLGNAGGAMYHWLALDETIWKAGITALAPDLAIILNGTNDIAQNPLTLKDQLIEMAGIIRTAMPLCDILFVHSADSDQAMNGKTMQTWDEATREAAKATSSGYLSLYKCLGPYADADARGLMLNFAHVNAYGGQVCANAIIKNFLAVT